MSDADLKLSEKELESLKNAVDLAEVDDSAFFAAEEADPAHPMKAKPSRPSNRSGPLYSQKFETLTHEASSVADNPEIFDGLRFEYNRHVSDRLSLSHICQGTVDTQGQGQDPGEYMLAAQCVLPLTPLLKRLRVVDGETPTRAGQPALPENRFVGVFRTGTRGDYMSRLMVQTRHWTSRLMLTGRSGPRNSTNWQSGLEYTGPSSHLSLQLSTNQGITASYVGQVHPSGAGRSGQTQIHLGTQLNYVHSQAASALALVGRIEKGTPKNKQVLTVMGSDSPSPLSNLPGVAQICYARKLDTGITWASRLLLMRNQNSDLYGFMAHASIGYEYRFATSGSLKGTLDSSGRVSVLTEQILSPIMSLSLCFDADYGAKEYKAGLGLAFHL
ncbi:MAG: hypothetical protein Q8P67_13620 [archaeon]|nr:hypothetical protein [archaeon]